MDKRTQNTTTVTATDQELPDSEQRYDTVSNPSSTNFAGEYDYQGDYDSNYGDSRNYRESTHDNPLKPRSYANRDTATDEVVALDTPVANTLGYGTRDYENEIYHSRGGLKIEHSQNIKSK